MAAVWDPGFVVHGGDMDQMKLYNFDVWFCDEAHRKQIEDALDGIALLNPHGKHPSADVTILGWDKGDGVKAVAEYMHVPLENTYAFGDGINDISMLKMAGHSVAMGNGQDAVKAAAEYVTTGINEDGVWNGLKHFHLI